MRTAVITAAALIGAAAFAFAGERGEPNEECGVSTYEMVECLKAKTAYWDKRMNIAYQQALKDAVPQQREQLRVAQRLWIQYRDANCLYYGLTEGSIARIDAGKCMRSMMEARARELEGVGDRK
ncbi:MAG TPA: lysozyme inhibitor LprI family protein [Pseudolabrys sp.]